MLICVTEDSLSSDLPKYISIEKKRKLLVVVKIMTNFSANIFSEYRVQRGAPESKLYIKHTPCTRAGEKSANDSYFPFIVNRRGLEKP